MTNPIRLKAVPVGVLLILATLAAQATDPAAIPARPATPDPEEILVLPPIVVNGRLRTKGWIHARSGRTEVYSQLSTKETRILVEDFLLFQDFVAAHFPEAALPPDQPLTLVLCDRTKTYRLLGGETDRTSSALPGSSRYILIDAAEAKRPEQSIRRRYVALAFERHPPGRYPLWRQFGTREILARLIIRQDTLELGSMLHYAFGRQRAPDLARLLALTASEFNSRRGQPSNDDYYHATFFMHMCLFGATPAFRGLRQPYQDFIRRLETEPLTEEMFRECFGMDFATMGNLLRTYMTGGANVKFESRHYRFSPGPPPTIRSASPGEIARLFEATQALRPPTHPEKEAPPDQDHRGVRIPGAFDQSPHAPLRLTPAPWHGSPDP